MAALYADENFSHPVVAELQNLGHDVLTAQDAGNAGKKIADVDVLSFAIQQKRAVVTFNRHHFKRLHKNVQPHHGIIICTNDDDIAALARRIHDTIENTASLDSQLLSIVRPRTP